MSFTVSTTELAMTREKVAAANKRAAKAGIAAQVEVRVVETVEIKDTNEIGFVRTRVVHRCEFVGLEDLKLGDWVLVGTLDHDAAGNIFRVVPGFEGEVPAEFRGTDAERCDHCGYRRQRNQTILVWNEAEGFKQVGSDCVKLFLGVSAHALIGFVSEFDESAYDEDYFGGGWSAPDYSVDEFVAAAALVTAVYGFRPSSFDDSTREVALELIAPKREVAKASFERRFPAIANPDAKMVERANVLAAEAMAWIAGQEGNSDYIVNLRLAAAREALGKNAGLLASLPNAYKRAVEGEIKRQAKAALPESAHVGQVGDKVTTKATVVYTNRSEGYSYYSPDSLFVILQGQDGNVFYVNTTVETKVGMAFEDADKETVFEVTGTVKAHKVNNKGQAITVLTRTKAEEV